MTAMPARPSALRAFLSSEAAGGIILMATAFCAMIVANSPLADSYHHMLHHRWGPTISDKLGQMNAHLWINDGLMAVFFLFVGLEIKRELIDGRLATWKQRRLPVVAAIAGMAAPALVYLAFTRSDPALANGWAIPAATDIAFAIGVLALLGPRAPTALKLFLVTVAIVDDMGAVAIIALFYTSQLALAPLAGAAAVLALLYAIGKRRERRLLPYLLGFALVWLLILLSGIHATIAGVATAMVVPLKPTPGTPDDATSPLHRLEHALAKPVAFFIVPLFGFANAGIDLTGVTLADALSPLPLGIAAGLFLGKQLGVFAAVWLAVKSGWARKPRGSTWLQIYAVSILCGIGFTMSLFIGSLAFTDPLLIEEAKLGTLAGSLIAALVGYALLRFAPLARDHAREETEQAEEIARDGDVEDICDDEDEGEAAR